MFHLHLFSLSGVLVYLSSSAAFETKCNVTDFGGCDFRGSGLASIGQREIPRDCQSVTFSGNQLTVVEDFAFVNLSMLLQLDLSRNVISRLEPRAFSGLRQLTCLDLSRNGLHFTDQSFPNNVFRPLTRMKALNIGGNFADEHSSAPDLAIKSLVALESLQIDMMSTVKMGRGFSALKNLKVLACGTNSDLKSVPRDFFHYFGNLTITSLILFDCGITDVEPATFVPFRYLKRFVLARNHRLGLPSAMACLKALVHCPLEEVNLSHVNSFASNLTEQSITVDMMRRIEPFCIRHLDLSDNLVVHFDPTSLYHINAECLQSLHVDRMYILENEFIYAFLTSLRFQNLRVLTTVGSVIKEQSYPEEEQTQSPNKRVGAINSVIFIHPYLTYLNISRSQLHCDLEDKVIKIQNALNLRSLDISYTSSSECFHREIQGLENLKTLVISGNEYSETLSIDFFSSFPNLTRLVARDTSLVNAFQTRTDLLYQLGFLQHLDIANSGLTSLPSKLLAHQRELRTLDLSHNKLAGLPEAVYSLSMLRTLDLRYNAIVSIPRESRRSLEHLARVSGGLGVWLTGNPFACNCETYDFVEWIWTANLTFDRSENYSCLLNNGSIVTLVSLKTHLRDRQVACISSFWATFGAVGVSLLVVIVMVSAIGYRYRVPIKYWFYTLCQKREARPGRQHRYDALVAYYHEDYQWVCHTLYPRLKQHGDVYRLCIQDRDFRPGVPIEENIVSAINSCFKIILVITPGFVESMWCRFEMEMVRMKMIQEGREDVVIPVILRDVPVSSMPRSLLNLWNTSVFLLWRDSPAEQRHFWDNLLAALGPPAFGPGTQADTDYEYTLLT